MDISNIARNALSLPLPGEQLRIPAQLGSASPSADLSVLKSGFEASPPGAMATPSAVSSLQTPPALKRHRIPDMHNKALPAARAVKGRTLSPLRPQRLFDTASADELSSDEQG